MPDAVSAVPSPRIAALGLGCVTFGREIDAAAAFRMMDHAHAHGITFFDTAAAYGGGASERIVGDWIRERGFPRTVTLATKILPPYTPAGVLAAVEASAQRLGAVKADVLFLHRWDATVSSPDVLRVLDQLVRAGSVRALAASNFTSEQLEAALQLQDKLGVAKFSLLQNVHNYAVRSIDRATLDVCARHGVRIVTYSPLGAGFLTAKHEQQVQPGSRFDLIPGHQAIYFNDQARARLARLREVAAQTDASLGQLALHWALRQPGVDTVLVGGRTTSHLDQALAARAPALDGVLRALEGD